MSSTVGNQSSAGTRRPAKRRSTARRRSPARRRPTTRRTAGSRRRPRRSAGGVTTVDLRRWWPALLVAAAVVVGIAWDSKATPPPPPATGMCPVPGSALVLTAEQATNAATIAAVARDRGLPDRAVVLALATAQQESHLRNLPYGDRDSLGLFQQRPSQGWGTPAQVQDPAYAAGKFYDHLVRVPGWQTGRLTVIAQRVQRSGFPEAYQKWGPMAVALTTALKQADLHRLTCR